MSKSTLQELFQKLNNDPILVELVMAINRFPGITAKELKQLFFMSGNKIYYYLNKLEEQHMVNIKEEEIKRNFRQKRYYSELEFKNQEDFLKTFREAKTKEQMILKLHFISMLLQRQIERIQGMSQSEFQDLKQKSIDIASFYTFNGDLSDNIKEQYKKLQDLMLEEVYNIFGSNLESRIAQTTHIGFTGFFPIF